MKKLYVILCMMLVLSGCTQNSAEPLTSSESYVSSSASDPAQKYIDAVFLEEPLTSSESHVSSPASDPAQKYIDAVFLEIEKDIYSLTADEISYTIINGFEEDVYIMMIPQLHRETDEGWEEVDPVGVGFCGVPDRVESNHHGILPLDWYADSLVNGRYRLSFAMVESDSFENIEIISDIFVLKNEEGVTMTVKENYHSPTGATFVLANNSALEYMYIQYYTLEKQNNIGDWEYVDPIIENYEFNELAYILEEGKISELVVDWERRYGELAAGKYRMVKEFSHPGEGGASVRSDISAEFEIE